MSCWIMDENRIASLARHIMEWYPRGTASHAVGQGIAGEFSAWMPLADAMLVMNIESFRARYGRDATLCSLDGLDADSRPSDQLSPIQFFKSLTCYLYQCSEGDLDKTPLYKGLKEIELFLSSCFSVDSPEYDAAEWG